MRVPLPLRTTDLPRIIGVVVVLFASSLTLQAQADDKPDPGSEPQAEFSVLAGMATRHASTDDSINPDGIGYDPAFQLGFQGRGYVWPWLNFAVYHKRASHKLNLPHGAAGMDYNSIDMGTVLTYSLGARLEPTYPVTDSFRTWLSIGVGWGRMSLEKVTVHEDTRSYTVRERAGVFVEVPIGIGASYEVIPRWLRVQAEANVAHLSKQSGKLFDTTPYVDDQGSLGTVDPMPTQTISTSMVLGVSLIL